MNKCIGFVTLILITALACKENASTSQPMTQSQEQVLVSTKEGMPVNTRFHPPPGYERKSVETKSFAHYLRHFPLYSSDRKVYYFNGNLKRNQSIHAAVLNIDVGTKDLQQCADAIMRLRAEYLYSQKAYVHINFHFVNGFHATYADWRKGKRIRVDGNKTSWYQTNKPSTDYESFMEYMEMVFMYAGTPSLEKELKPQKLDELEIGDVFIQGGSPGHAIIVMDVAVNETSGDKVFLLAQSYMPAQDIHVLKNPMNKQGSPWYNVNEINNILVTPEWQFKSSDLRRF